MPPVEKKRRSKRFAEWEEKPVKDFDPENEIPDEPENSDSEESADERAGTEHYVSVGKSKLRGKESINLGPEYRGARVSRAALEQSDEDDDDEEDEESEEEEFADPDTADLELDQVDDDAEISSDDALGESDNEKLKGFVFRGSSKPLKPLSKNLARRPKAADFMQVEESGEEEEEEEGSEEDGVSVPGSEEDEEEESDLEDYSGEEEEDSELEEREGAMLFDDEAEETDNDSGDDEEDEEEDESEDDDEEEDGEDEDDDRAEMRRAMGNDTDDVKADIRKAMSDGLKTVVNTISQAAKQEAEQGKAVRTQRRAFDSILNLRIRLQKALIAANTFHVAEKEEDAVPSEAYQAAEEAAVKLWNTIDSVRSSLAPPTKTGEKRKRSAITLDTPTQEIWESMQSLESIALSRRRKVLDKWSSKVRLEAGGLTKTRRLVDSSSSSLVSVLEDQLLGNSDRHIKRVRTPRSCAPFQSAKKVELDSQIYDDADFYQLLLKELVDQRSTDAAAPGGQHVATVRWAAIKEAKTRKVVDRKASKGRKLRYTVHEKLQNFMAPEDRRTWEEHAVDRLFGALFGQKMVLGEEEEEEEEEEDMEMGGVGVNGEEGLKLFGN